MNYHFFIELKDNIKKNNNIGITKNKDTRLLPNYIDRVKVKIIRSNIDIEMIRFKQIYLKRINYRI